MKLSFGKPKAKAAPTPILKQPVAFGSLNDDEPLDAAPTATSSRRDVDANKRLAAQTLAAGGGVAMSRAMKKRLEEEKKVDATVYEYDEVYDRMQEAKQRQKEQKELEALDRKPKYIGAFLESAQTRKLDRLRAEEKMLQREREAEGDEFADKEQFVTQAYKDQMEEVRKAEEEEKKREALHKSKKGFSSGMSHFYKQLLEQSEAEHTAAVTATTQSPVVTGPTQSKRQIGPSAPAGPNLTITRPSDEPLSDLERARIAASEGKKVELNDDNQIVDQRDLLSAGLNLSAPNTRQLGFGSSKRKLDAKEGEVVTHRAVGTAASRKEIAARREREIATQLKEEEQRAAEEARRKEEERLARVVQKRNTEEDVQTARQRYLERKRRKLEEANANPEPSEGGG
ncbi:hypothetical protein SCHPADRAFT_997291 [Schizopora paradoxa]|uniref:Nuclear speckle splicing regulatory protein 1 N-terminal domain-containing protein n=1 Tax=Schizopora paradoxa TaxID=27342 RepID=A0A0H2RVR9_9AGAM|nr:hypothetical protein SCHPADRAFT_997291 [Schizopora paradoxa]